MRTLKYCRKRDGSIVAFDKSRIQRAIYKAFLEANEGNKIIANKITETVVERLERMFLEDIPEVEEIQDVVEDILMNYHFKQTAKCYILYRDKHNRMREMSV